MSSFSSSGPGSFLRAFGADSLTRMSGPWSVPFATLALFLPQKWAKLLFGALALVCLVAGAYFVWRRERVRVLELEERLRPKLEIVVDRTCELCARGEVNTNSGEFEWTVSVGLRNSSGYTIRGVQLVLLSLRHPNGDQIEGLVTPAFMRDSISELHSGGHAHAGHIPLVSVDVTHLGPVRLYTNRGEALRRENYTGRLQVRAQDLTPAEINFEIDFDSLNEVAPVLRLSDGTRSALFLRE